MVVFVLLGVGVYQVTAPAAPADAPGFSLGRLMDMAKAQFHGPQARRTVARTATLVPGAEVAVLDLTGVPGPVVVEGTDRPDILVRLDATLGGLDAEDLDKQEKALTIALESAGPEARVRFGHDVRGRRLRLELRIDVPRRLKVRLGDTRMSAEVRGVAGLDLKDYAGDLRVEGLTGPVTGRYESGRAEFGDGTVLQLKTESGRVRLERPASVTLDSERTGIDIIDAAGPITIKEDYARMDIRGTGGPVRITGDGGTIALRQLAHALAIDATRLTVDAEIDTPVPVTIAVKDDDVDVTLPRTGGVNLEVAVTDGDLRVPDGLTPTVAGTKQSVTTAVNGGGPLVKLTLERGTMRVRGRSGT
ncbi:DUF4097 domain-containing protein [Luteitalea sp. TBR-22]|uniref:DUF4097 domain-containing protein n=1 Tax=Luteitalea sp. TBR-22 TaxID=2802971 RepID=UPI001EF538C2|nr:DUF4097 domain-containing protein [Luteitalea sp. TBR-22]